MLSSVCISEVCTSAYQRLQRPIWAFNRGKNTLKIVLSHSDWVHRNQFSCTWLKYSSTRIFWDTSQNKCTNSQEISFLKYLHWILMGCWKSFGLLGGFFLCVDSLELTKRMFRCDTVNLPGFWIVQVSQFFYSHIHIYLLSKGIGKTYHRLHSLKQLFLPSEVQVEVALQSQNYCILIQRLHLVLYLLDWRITAYELGIRLSSKENIKVSSSFSVVMLLI